MNRTIMALLIFSVGFLAFSQTPVTQKLDALGVKNATIKDNPSALIKKMYQFDENKVKGAIIVFALKELKLDVVAVIMQSGTAFTVVSVEALNPKAFSALMMGRIKASLSRWDNMKDNKIPDAVSSATRYSKALFVEIGNVAENAFSILKNTARQ